MRRHYASRGRSRGRGQGTISQTLFRRLLYLNRLYSIDWCCRCETHWTPLKMVKEVSFFLVFGWKNRERRETELGWFFFPFRPLLPSFFSAIDVMADPKGRSIYSPYRYYASHLWSHRVEGIVVVIIPFFWNLATESWAWLRLPFSFSRLFVTRSNQAPRVTWFVSDY